MTPSIQTSVQRADTAQFVAWVLEPGRLVLLVGLAALIVPTVIRMAVGSWSTELGTHGPIVLATALWFIWYDRSFLAVRTASPLLPFGLLLLPLLAVYVIGRITSSLVLETGALYLILLVTAWLRLGPQVIRRYWFVCVYLLFLITPPANWIFVATRPIKMALPVAVVDVLTVLGFSVGSSGTMIQIDGYQLLVATACSGVNSLIGISAISLFYVYLLHGTQPRFAIFLAALVLPIAILTNFLRILLLVLMTHWFGEGAAEGVSHSSAALATIALALGLLFASDALLFPLFRRAGWTR